ncbi:MAG: type II toxin-antitoxin system VapC family toxin [Bdellovibrionaceae bacterium]|nr:type II toxin-antitoxin system VapC family toxin [Pseudobdellovibrionaceae bacterium]
MIGFPDTSFLCALYRAQANSARADHCMARLSGALPVSTLLLLEFRQSVRLQIRLHLNDRSKGFGQAEGQQMLNDLQIDLHAGLLATTPVDWPAVHQRAEFLSSAHTLAAGHRLVDILHVATALQLGAGEFLTFDANQRKLAEAEGLVVPL